MQNCRDTGPPFVGENKTVNDTDNLHLRDDKEQAEVAGYPGGDTVFRTSHKCEQSFWLTVPKHLRRKRVRIYFELVERGE
jgi:hypothetical protein